MHVHRYYEVKIEALVDTTHAAVLFVDYGNTELVLQSDLVGRVFAMSIFLFQTFTTHTHPSFPHSLVYSYIIRIPIETLTVSDTPPPPPHTHMHTSLVPTLLLTES